MATTTMTTTMAMLNAKCLSPSKPVSKPVSMPSLSLPKGLITMPNQALTGAAIAGAVFSTLGSVDPALAAQQIADIAEGDNRGLALLLPIIPAIGWVLFNILQPALNQINRMRSQQGLIAGLGLTGLAATGLFLSTPGAHAGEVAAVAEAQSDSRGQLLLLVVLPAIGWVLYNILQPALNQLNRMRSR